MSDKAPVVLDNGSGFIKAGFSGANFPTAVIPNVIGRPVLRAGTSMTDSKRTLKPTMIGDETDDVRHLLDTQFPVKNGVVRDYDSMCLIWDYTFGQKLKVDPKEHRLMMSEPPSTAHPNRNKLFEVMFETYGFEALQTGVQGVLSLYSAGLESGLAVDCGECVTHCTPVFEGWGIPKANRRVDLGGRDITEFLVRLLQRRGYTFNKSADFETVRRIKEMFCYAAVDFKLERALALETTVLEKAMTLPDGSTCRIGVERFEATEALFSPGLLDIECDGLSNQIWSSIQAADIDIRKRLFENVVLSGGSTMFPGLPTRIERDIKALYLEKSLKGDKSRLNKFPLKINDPPRRKHMVFLGAACMAQMSEEVEENWLSKAEYEEAGESAVRAKFGQQ